MINLDVTLKINAMLGTNIPKKMGERRKWEERNDSKNINKLSYIWIIWDQVIECSIKFLLV